MKPPEKSKPYQQCFLNFDSRNQDKSCFLICQTFNIKYYVIFSVIHYFCLILGQLNDIIELINKYLCYTFDIVYICVYKQYY